jgi:hypothetical protein
MLRRSSVVVVVAGLFALSLRSGVLFAQAPAAVSSQTPVEELIEQLGSNSATTRGLAEKELQRRGEPVVPQLAAAIDKTAESQLRASASGVLAEIRRQSLTLPTLITLDVKDATVKDVFERIARQAGARVAASSDDPWQKLADRTVTLNVKNEPYWNVMKDLLPKFGLVQLDRSRGNSMEFMLGSGPRFSGPSYLSGPFLIVATNVRQSKEIDLSLPAEKQPAAKISITAQVHVEPKIHLLGHDFEPKLDEFVDDAGHSLVSDERAFQTPFDTTPTGPRFGFILPVADVAGRTNRVSKLKGSIRAFLLVKSDTIDVPDLLHSAGVTRQKGEWNLTVEEISPARIRVQAVSNRPATKFPPGGKGPMPQWLPGFDPRDVHVVDATGREVETRSPSYSRGSTSRWQHEFRLEGAAAAAGANGPLTLFWDFPVEWKEIRIPFELKDIPLP